MNAKRPIVYVIDDEPHFRKSMVLMLSATGFDVIDHPSCESFLESLVIQSDSLRCAIVDMNMDGLSGLGLLPKLNERGVNLPVIIITAFANVASAVQAMRAGAVDFLEKPFHRQALLESVRRGLDLAAGKRTQHSQANAIRDRLHALSNREKEVIELLLAAKTTKEIAGNLDISAKTVAKHRAHAFEKLGIGNVVELVGRQTAISHARDSR